MVDSLELAMSSVSEPKAAGKGPKRHYIVLTPEELTELRTAFKRPDAPAQAFSKILLGIVRGKFTLDVVK